jgi:acetyl esterase/lipase
MLKHHLLSLRFVMMLALGAIAALANAEPSGRPPNNPFKSLDRNGDGQLTRDEFPGVVGRLFDQIDADGDGAISAEEDAAYRGVSVEENQPRLPDTVRAVFDVQYADTDHPRQRLDLLLPKEPADEEPLPLIVFIHGGGWRGGNRREGLRYLTHLMTDGQYAGATIGYRFSSEALWPAQIHDCKAAIRWLRANAKEHNLDPERIAVIGPSAGGHLAAMLGTTGDVERLNGKVGAHLDVDAKVACVVDEYGPTDLLAMSEFPSDVDHDAPGSPESRLVGGPLPERKDAARDASPISYVSAPDPPFLIIHGTNDPLVPFDQSERLYDELRQVGVAAHLIRVEGGGHGGFRSLDLDRRVRLFFDKCLREESAELPTTPIQPGRR